MRSFFIIDIPQRALVLNSVPATVLSNTVFWVPKKKGLEYTVLGTQHEKPVFIKFVKKGASLKLGAELIFH